jgi:ATP-dependent Lhr-like helicase
VSEALGKYGAQYLDQIADRAGFSERDALAALWRMAAAGLVSNDSFAPLRLLWSEPDAMRVIRDQNGRDRAFTRHDAALRARLKSSLSGRWSIIQPAQPDADSANHETHISDNERELAMLLLKRNGVLTREMLALEQIDIPWQELLFTLRRMEYAGLIRRGWFVRALSGEQYALPEALEILRAMRARSIAAGPPVAISAADPANPYGVLLPGCGIPRESANLLVVRAGQVLLGLAGRALVVPDALDDETFGAAVAALMKLKPKLVIETIDGGPALESSHVRAMATMRFHSDGRALVYDGLPGPMPARAAAPQPQAPRD